MFRSTLFVLAALTAATPVFAAESLTQVGAAKSEKQALIDGMQARVDAHAKMSREEILADLTARVAANRELLVKAGVAEASIAQFDVNAATSMDRVGQLDKDGILALETAQVQNVMTSANYIFALIRWNMQYLEGAQHGAGAYSIVGQRGYLALTIICTPFAVIGDILLFPIELIMSAITGF